MTEAITRSPEIYPNTLNHTYERTPHHTINERDNMGRRHQVHTNSRTHDYRNRDHEQHNSPEPKPGTIAIERQFNADRVPTIKEVKEFFKHFKYGSKWDAVFRLMFFAGLRPCEVKRLNTHDVIRCHETGKWIGLNYAVGKPKPPGRPKKGEKPRKAEQVYNQIRVDREDLPQHVLDSLMTYWMNESGTIGLFFPNIKDQYRKTFSNIRKKMIKKGHASWGKSANPTKNPMTGRHDYAIGAYSGRRFFVTFYYWIVSPRLSSTRTPDDMMTSRRMCHRGAQNTRLYVHPYPCLGIGRDDIARGWDVLIGENKTQTRLNEYA